MSDSDRDALDRLADEFLARRRKGERPSIEEYAAAHPHLASEIRELFPTLEMMEELAPDERDTDAPPRQLGEYRILREIGRGGMGVVYEAEQVTLGRRVALKVLPFHRLLDKSRLERFRREAQAAARLHHPNIVPVHGVGEHEGTHFFAMQYVAGQGLDAVVAELKRLRRAGQPTSSVTLPRERGSETKEGYFLSVARIGIDVAGALEHAHAEGVLHRDIKPSNLLLDAEGKVWITDFGLAKADETEGLTRTGDVVGTLGYMAPERFQGWSDRRSDVYGLGLVLYELFALKPAFADSDINRLIKSVTEGEPARLPRETPRDLETITRKAMAKDPGQRYATASQLKADLERFLRGEPIRARRSTVLERTRKWARRRPAAAALVAVSIVAAVVVVVGSLWYSGQLSDALARERREARRSRASALCSASEAVQASDPMLSLLLAREAGRVRLLPEVETRLHQALQASLERPPLRHPTPVTAAIFGREGTVVTGCLDGSVRIWNRDGSVRAVLKGHTGEIVILANSRRRLLSVSSDGTARLWDPKSASAIAVLDGVSEASFSRSKELLLGVTGARAHLWDMDGKVVAVLSGHAQPLRTARFSHGGKRVLTVAQDEARLWDLKGVLQAKFPGDGQHIWSVAAKGDRVVLTFVPKAGPVEPQVWDDTGRLIRSLACDKGAIWFADFIDKDSVLTVSVDEDVRLWSRDGSSVRVRSDVPGVEEGIFEHDGQTPWWPLIRGDAFVIPDEDIGFPHPITGRGIAAWDAAGRLSRTWGWSNRDLVKIQLSPDLEKVLLVESDRRAYLRDAVPMLLGVLDQASRPLYSPDGGLAAAQLSRDGRVLATADTLVRLWQSDVEEVTPPSEFGPLKGSVKRSRGDDLVVLQGERSFTLRGQEGRSASDPVFSPVGDRVLIEVDDSVGLWGADGNRVARLPGHSVFCLMDASFSPDGNYFLTSCSHDKQPRRWLLWDRNGRLVNDGLPLGHWEPDFSGTSDRVIAIHPNQSSILIVDLQGKLTARIDPSWRWQESEHGIHAIRAPTSGNHFLAVLAEGRRQVDADSSVRFSGNYKVRIYDLDGKKRFAFDFEEATFAADEDPGSPVASYSPTNDRILVAGLTGDVLLADIDGREISLLKEHAGPVADAAFSPAGDRIATVGVDGSVRLWTTHGELRALVTATEGKAPVQFTRDGKTLRTDGGNFWAVYGPDLLALADERITRDFTAEERRRYAELLGESGE